MYFLYVLFNNLLTSYNSKLNLKLFYIFWFLPYYLETYDDPSVFKLVLFCILVQLFS